MNAPFVVCLVMFIGFAVAIPWAILTDRAELHLLHKPGSGCPECDAP